MVGSKHVFWQSLVFTIVVFSVGLIFGFFLETYRADIVQENLMESEINLLDEQLIVSSLEGFDVSCEDAKSSVFAFADRIYEEALRLEQFEDDPDVGSRFYLLHRRYDLLRTLLWLESVKLKEKCRNDFTTVVYLYEFATDDVNQRAKQIFFSRLLFDAKSRNDDVLLIPIAVNTDLTSVDLVVNSYDVDEFPVIVINEEIILRDVITLEDFEEFLSETS